jgi:hypothetical protein
MRRLMETPRLKSSLVLSCVAGLALVLLPLSSQAGEFGLAISSINYGPYDDPTDCPEGMALTPKETFLESLTPEKRKEFEDRDKRVGSLASWVSRVVSERRGPNGESACEAPELIKDPPMRVGQSKTSFGFDLDGGDLTTHCAHQKFDGANGQTGIDNQVARLTACIFAVRKQNNQRNQGMDSGTLSGNRINLIRVTNVKDMQNDDDVTIDLYKSADNFVKNGTGQPSPDATLRGDKNAPVFFASTHGKIVNGVLMTAPVDAHLIAGDGYEWDIRAARFQINLHPDGYGDGILAGYFDLNSFWASWAREYQQGLNQGFSCPALYEAMHSLADGYKDPATGQCTALSSAFHIKVVRTFISPPEPGLHANAEPVDMNNPASPRLASR